MPDATTPNYLWAYPTVNADSSTWGATLNATIIAIDAQVHTNALAAAPTASPTFTGTLTAATGNFSGILSGLAGVSAVTNTGAGFGVRINAAASGGAAILQMTDSSGTQWGTMAVSSSGGAFVFSNAVTATGFNGPLTGNVTGNCSGSSGSCTGNAATATSASSATTATSATSLTGASGVTAGTYANATVTVNAQGLVTSASAGINGPMWANVNANSGGATLNAGNGISSVSRIAAGEYQVNFVSAMPDTKYAVAATAESIITNATMVSSKTTTSFNVFLSSGADFPFSVLVMR